MRCCCVGGNLAAVLGLSAAIAGGAGYLIAVTGEADARPVMQEGQEGEMTMEQEMAAWLALADPSDEHKALAPIVGTFNAEARFQMDPTASEPMVSTGRSVNTWVLGKRFVQQTYTSPDMMGMPFEGIGYTGYDRVTKEYVGTWMDTWFTGVMVQKGQMTGRNEMRMESEMATPMGTMEKSRHVLKIIDDNKHELDFYKQVEGEWVKMGTIRYTRAAD